MKFKHIRYDKKFYYCTSIFILNALIPGIINALMQTITCSKFDEKEYIQGDT